jgi:hypothetical protein
MTQESFDQLQAWIQALTADLVTQPQWTDWALGEIERSQQPEGWICCLATAWTAEEALDVLSDAMRRMSDTLRWLNPLSWSLGLLYWRSENGQIALDVLLRAAGDKADGANASNPPCETYYGLWTSLEQGQRPRTEIESEVARLFEQPLLYTKAVLRRISVEL